MDGTITVPRLDFDQIRRDMGLGPEPILESMARLDADEQAKARRVLEMHERVAAEQADLNPGIVEFLHFLKVQKIPSALITRNSADSVKTVLLKHQLFFPVCVTRDDGVHKPDPRSVQLACDRLGVRPGRCWMVGDGYHDVQAGQAAGCTTVWISHGAIRDFEPAPDFEVADVVSLLNLLRRFLNEPTTADSTP